MGCTLLDIDMHDKRGCLEEEMKQMPDLLARVALAKEGNDTDAAHQALTVFNAVAQEHIKQVRCLLSET